MPRLMLSAACLALLAACGSPAPEPPVANRPEQLKSPPAPTPSVSAGRSAPGEIKAFRDWVVGCDNLDGCKAVAVLPEDRFDDPDFSLAIERDGGPDGAVRIVVTNVDGGDDKPRLLLNGSPVATARLTGPDAREVARALANGRTARLESGDKGNGVSLAGAAAALRYMDEMQGHAGSAAGLVAKGSGPERAIRREMPVVRLPTRDGDVPTLKPDFVQRMRDLAGCEYYSDVNRGDPDLYPLGGGRTLAMLPCGAGAYNTITAVLLIENGTARPAPVDRLGDAPTGGDEKAPTVINASYADGIIDSWAKGRGLGDCGISERFGWDGERFRVIERSEMPECRGSRELITTWRARVEE